MTDKEKIAYFLEQKGISKNQFYKRTGFSTGFLDSGSSLGVDKFKIILDNYPDFNPDWLFKNETIEEIKESMQEIHNENANHNLNSNINGKVNGNITISNNDFQDLIDTIGNKYDKLYTEVNSALKTCQAHLTESQKQMNILLEIIKEQQKNSK